MTMFYVLASCADIPCPVFSIAHIIETLIQWAVPIIIIIFGMIDFGKAAMAHDEGDIAKAKQTFIRRLIAGACVFFVMTILELTVSNLAVTDNNAADGKGKNANSAWQCVKLIFSGDVSEDSGLCDNDPFDDATTPDPDADPE